MKHVELVRQARKLDSLFDKAKALLDDLELQSHWARYLCVLTCGFLENAVRTVYRDYARRNGHPYLHSYVGKTLDRSCQNLKMGRIIELTRQFSKEWADVLEQNTDGQIKAHVDSIVAHRHLIAHGRDTSISFVQLREYYRSTIKLVDLLEEQCG